MAPSCRLNALACFLALLVRRDVIQARGKLVGPCSVGASILCVLGLRAR